MPRDNLVDDRIGAPVQTPLQQQGRFQEQLVDRDAEAGSELPERLGVRLCAAVQNAPDGPWVQTGLPCDLLDRESGLGC